MSNISGSRSWATRDGGGPATEETITRKTYSAGGQAIATRVSGDPVSTNNGLFYFHSDHLGSATFLTYGNGHANEGLKVANSTKFFTPFGEYRIEPPSPVDGITDRGYTGHRHNDYIKLIYMGARWYLPGLGRFASADTIVPNPSNPQSYNRYSYAGNNVVNRIDPTGHRDCEFDENCGSPIPAEPNPNQINPIIDFGAADGEVWTAEEKALVIAGAWKVAQALYEAGGGLFSSAYEAFMAVYGGTVTFYKTGINSTKALGEATSKNFIKVYNRNGVAITDDTTGSMWAAHELGHAFNYALWPNTTDNLNYGQGMIDLALEGLWTADGEKFAGLPDGSTSYSNYNIYERAIDLGYQSTSGPYIQNDKSWPNEDFADMFSNWTYNTFTTDAYGIARYDFMQSHMAGWIALAVNNNQ